MTYSSSSLSALTRRLSIDEKSLDAVRWLQSIRLCEGDLEMALDRFKRLVPESSSIGLVTKAAVDAGGAAGTWGSALLPTELGSALLAAGSPFSVLDRIGFTRVPFNTSVPIEGASSVAVQWTGAGLMKPVGQLSLTAESLPPRKIAGILALTKELERASTPSAIGFVRDRLSRALVAFTDSAAFLPTFDAVTNVAPASLTAAPLSAVSVPGTDPWEDIAALVAAFVSGGGRLERAAFVLGSTNAVALQLIGGRVFEDLTPTGGRLAGVDAYASDALTNIVALVDRDRIILADDGGISVDMSTQSSLRLDDGGGSGTETVSLWQNNMVGVRVERFANWLAAAGAVAFLERDFLTAT
jgi:hypothetical protein